MGDPVGWAQPSGLLPNALLPDEAVRVTRVLDMERWSKAEERTAELIACIQPNQPSEERRNAVADYVQRLMTKCFSCQVFTFGSVPLKTYLPDGDIDLTAFSKNQNLKDTWAQEVRDMLEKEEKSEDAEFRVKEVQYIQAEVKIIKCLVENIVVDISFNQLGGLCTLCFLEEVDHLIDQDHLFKRSIILIKAWCYYESRILGAHHGLISTYALETLVLYIFHVFNNSFSGPLEVLYRFLEFFSNFDWDNFCVSLWGPVRISSLPDMTAEPPRDDSGELLLSKLFLDACSSVYAVFPSGQENQNQPFVSKHFNVIDPLRTNNNLGRSVSKGNFYRIRSAFAFGARRLARVLECPKENLIAEINQFFMNTWERHGSGVRPDASLPDQCPSRPLSEPDSSKDRAGNKKKGESTALESQAEGLVSFQGISLQSVDNISHSNESMPRTNSSAFSRIQSQKIHSNQKNSSIMDQVERSSDTAQVGKGRIIHSSGHMSGEHEGYNRHLFARTQSSPELTDNAGEGFSRGKRNQFLEAGKNHYISTGSRRQNLASTEVSTLSPRTRSSHDDRSSLKHSPSNQSLETVTDSTGASNIYNNDVPVGVEELASETMDMHQEEQDLVNMMASPRVFNFNGQVQVPFNLVSTHLPLPLSHSLLASMSYAQRNLAGMVPSNVPLIDHPLRTNGQPFPRGVASSVSHYFPSTGLTSNSEDVLESGHENSGLTNVVQEDNDGVWLEHDGEPSRLFHYDNGNVQMVHPDEKLQPTPAAFSYVPSRGNNFSGTYAKGQHKFVNESRGQVREDPIDTLQSQSAQGNDNYSSDRSSNMRYIPGSQTGTSRSKPASESSWDGSSVKSSKSTRDKRGRKTGTSSVPSSSHGRVKSGWHHEGPSYDRASSQTDDNNRDWVPVSMINTEMVERSSRPASIIPSHLQSHQLAGYDNTQISGSDSVIPIAPMLVNSSSSQRSMDGSGLVPIAFYPTGPPVPILTMLPMYNFPTETGNSDNLTSHSDRDDVIDSSSRISQTMENFDSADSLDQSEMFPSSSVKSFSEEPTEERHKSDILNSDFASHWQNLQYGRFCQNTQQPGSAVYPSPVMFPQMYVPWEGPGRPISAANANLFAQMMGYGPRLVPVPLQPGSSRPPTGVYQRYGDEVPRYRGGTGTYLPNPKVSYRDRQSSNTRSHRGNYHSERNERVDREGNWNAGSRTRPTGRGHGRNQTEKQNLRPDRMAASDTRTDRQWDPYKHEQSYNSYQVQNGPFSSTSSFHVPANTAYGMYGMSSVNSNGVTSTGPSVVMLYSYDPSVGGYGSPSDQLEFGSLGPVQFSGGNEGSQHADGGPTRAVYEQRHGTYRGGSSACSSPDQPSTPQLQRSEARRKYELKDDDFPPLSFPNDGGDNVGQSSSYDTRSTYFQTFFFAPHS